MFFDIPGDLRRHIYEMDTTYRDYMKMFVLDELIKTIKHKIMTQIESYGDDFQSVYNYLVSDSINTKLLTYNTKFHKIDQRLFNHYFMRKAWTENTLL